MNPDNKSGRQGANRDETGQPDRGQGPPGSGPGPAQLAAQRGRGAARGAPGAVQESPGQGGRAGLAGVREAGPGPGRAVRHRLRLHRGRPDAGHGAAARSAGGGRVPGGPPRSAGPLRRAGLRRGRPGRPGPAGPRHRRDGHRAPGRPRRPAARPQRDPGARGARRAGPARAARARPAAAELRGIRVRAGPRQRRPAAGPAGGGDPEAGTRGAGHHPVPRRAGLVPGHARADRQRLPVPGRAARPRPGDGVHPLRPGQRPGRPSHPGHGPAAAHRVRALGLRADRPGRGGGQRGVPARARLQARVGPGPAHPGQPDLRLLARPGQGDVRALHRRRRVRLHDAARVGTAITERPLSVGAEGDRGVHRHQRPARRRGGDQGPAGQGQRGGPGRAARADQGDELMSTNLARTAEAWWAVTPAGLVRLGLPAATTAALLADRAALAAAIEAAQAAAPQDAVPAESVDLLSPVTAPARVVAQAVNYRSHAIDSGFDPATVPPAFFRKASHSITGPAGDIIRPDGVGFLDYEVELGLVIGTDLPVGTTVTEADLARYVAALVVADDVSAQQIQLVKTQFYESKSYPTFTPAGPWLTLADAADLARLGSLRLMLRVNGEVRQDSTVADMIVGPARALTLLSRFQPMAPGDLLLTGTPGGTALKAPAKLAGTLAGLLPPATRWKLFFSRQAGNPRYLHDGDVITATIASPDGRLDLGTQHNTIIGKLP